MHRAFHRTATVAACAAAALTLAPAHALLGQPDPRADYESTYGLGGYGILGYETALPTGDASNFVSSSMSWLGISFAGHRVVRPNMSVGFEAGWNEFHDRTGGTTVLQQGAITGEQYRHLMQFPLLVTGRYYFKTNTTNPAAARLRPFGGIGLGTYYTRQLLDVGLNEYTADEWQFGIAPEAGVLFLTSGESIVQLRVRYNYPFKSGDYLGGGGRSFNNFTFGLGVGFHR